MATINDAGQETWDHWPYDKSYWWLLSLDLRERWWKETDYNRKPASIRLMMLITAELLSKLPDAGKGK